MRSLILFATKYGSVEKCAYLLKEKITGEVDIVNIRKDKVPALDMYDKVMLGGSIYIGKIQKEILRYCREKGALLKTKKLGLFLCAGEESDKRYGYFETSFTRDLCEHAASKEIFGHELYYEKMSLLDKLALRFAKKPRSSYSRLDMESIQKFASSMNRD
ncbi:MAG: flavodoxin [Candidatus Aureabacteria bacterium]|nr:flavodoxin [Candidatus Auribacterota bacterium]